MVDSITTQNQQTNVKTDIYLKKNTVNACILHMIA